MPKNANEKPALAGPGRPKTDVLQGLAHPRPGQPRLAPASPNGKICSAFQASLSQSTPSHFFVVVVDQTSPKLVREAIN